MGRVVHFEIPAADPVRAAEFYKEVRGEESYFSASGSWD